MNYYVGVDIGGTGLKVGLVDEQGEFLTEKKCKTRRGAENVISDIVGLIRSVCSESPAAPVAVGIGCPGLINSKNGEVVYSNNLDWHNVPIKEIIQKEVGMPAFITNDANAAALGECFCGAGKKYDSMIMITLGTGVGSGIVVGGKLFEGNMGSGVELGHEVICVGGEKCTCGRRGCFEAYSSATALIRFAKRAMKKDENSLLWQKCGGDEEKVDGIAIFAAVRDGDKTAAKVVKKYIYYLSEGLANITNAFHPQALVLGGGICAAGDVFLKPLKKRVDKYTYGGADFAPVDLIIAELGNKAGICGAAKLAIDGYADLVKN